MKMNNWIKKLKFEPLISLLASNDFALAYFTRRELLHEKVEPIDTIWKLPEVQQILKKQQDNGCWKSSNQNRKKYPSINYSLIETWKNFRFLVEKYQMNRTHPSIKKAAEYILSCQKEEGDIRGFIANQYAIYYTGALMSLLIQAGYHDDPRIEKGFEWLISMKQDDGGWLGSNLMSLELSHKEILKLTSQDVPTKKEHDKSRPSSHNWTGMVIRAFANHPKYKSHPVAKSAIITLKKAFFSKDKHYTSYQDADYWIRFDFPFWWNHLVAAMDSISKIDYSTDDIDIKRALTWFIDNQQENGLWKLSYSKKYPIRNTPKARRTQFWISYIICCIFQRYYGE